MIKSILTRILALAVGIAALYGWWRTNGLPGFVFLVFDIGRRSPLLDKFIGFLSIIAMVLIILCFMAIAALCIGYAVNPSSFKDDGKQKASEPLKLMLAHRCAGIGIFFAGIVIVFLAFQIPDNTMSWLYDAGFRRSMRELISVPFMLLAIIAAMCGTVLAFAGGGMTLAPQKFRGKR